MRRSVILMLVASLAIAGGALAGCGDDEVAATPSPGSDGGGGDSGTTADGGGTTDGGTTDSGTTDSGTDGSTALLFTDYVKDLVQTKTADNTPPDDVMSKSFLPDPEDPAAFPASFF